MFTKNDKVEFYAHGLRLVGTVVRCKKNGIITVDAPLVVRLPGQPPALDSSETMLWDLRPAHLTKI